MNKKDAAKFLGSLGGDARKLALHPDRRSEIARIAALARWHGHVKPLKRIRRKARSTDFE